MTTTALRPPSNRLPVLGVMLGLAAFGLGWLLRYQLIEPAEIGAFCDGGGGPLWCTARLYLIVATEWGLIGWAAFACGALSLLFASRTEGPPKGVFAALVLGGAGLILYNATPAAFGVVLALIALIRQGGAQKRL